MAQALLKYFFVYYGNNLGFKIYDFGYGKEF